MTIINDNSRVVTELETSLTDNARVVIYDRHIFIVQATGDSNSWALKEYCNCLLLLKVQIEKIKHSNITTIYKEI